MTSNLTFTQAVSSFPWYVKEEDTDLVLHELDKDLKKWQNTVTVGPSLKQASCTVDARFGSTMYSFVINVHPKVDLCLLTPDDIPEKYKYMVKVHTRARNILKNFIPIVFDKLVADNQLHLIQVGAAETASTSYCVWATNVAGLGLTVTTLATTDEEPLLIERRQEWITNILMYPIQKTPSNQKS